jgi:heme/copper-type cytochrome/quinol oxidase subunit 3
MEKISKILKSNKLPLNFLVFLLGTIVAFGLSFSAYEYKYDHTNPYDPAYGASGTSPDGTHYDCLMVDPSIGCNKTIYQAMDQVDTERFFFVSAVVLIGIFISSIFIWFVSRNTKKDILLFFLLGSLLGIFFGINSIIYSHLSFNLL